MDNKILKELKKRKLVKVVSLKPLIVKKGSNFKLQLEKLETELTADMIADGSWETKKFKALNFDARPGDMPKGAFHPLLKVRYVLFSYQVYILFYIFNIDIIINKHFKNI